jgi:endogenous inhibitor of DNA gyrase (YacG/DUF329 family)
MEDHDQANPEGSPTRNDTLGGPDKPRPHLEFTCPTCKRRVRVSQKGRSKLPRFFPFCSARCKWIDLGAWLDADYRILSKPDEESEDSARPGPEGTEEKPKTEDGGRKGGGGRP